MADETPRLMKLVNQKDEQPSGSVFDDLESLRKVSTLNVKRRAVLVNVEVDKPPSNSYFRVHPTWILDDATVVKDADGSGHTFYFVTPMMRGYPKLMPRLRRVTLAVISIWPADTIMLWPVPILGDRDFRVWRSARAAFELAREKWTMITWDEARSDYAVEIAEKINHAPNWPDTTFEAVLKLGFDGKVVSDEDHPYVRRLRGIID
jgi:hypothetical protein